jgi:hypothetical protein
MMYIPAFFPQLEPLLAVYPNVLAYMARYAAGRAQGVKSGIWVCSPEFDQVSRPLIVLSTDYGPYCMYLDISTRFDPLALGDIRGLATTCAT